MFTSGFGNISIILCKNNAHFVSCFWHSCLFQSKFFLYSFKAICLQRKFEFVLNQGIWKFVWILQLVPASGFQTKTATNILPISLFSLHTRRENLHTCIKMENCDLENYFCLKCHINYFKNSS